MAISDRTSWEDVSTNYTENIYRGDCYINTYTHRMLWNFIDPELPNNSNIVDIWTWHKNYKVKKIKLTEAFGNVSEDATDAVTGSNTKYYYKLIDAFTFDNDNLASTRIILPDGKKYKEFSELFGVHGSDKISRVDVNTVPLGH
jgi:hypothetical protein